MIVAAALCPAPPLLVRELTGADQVAADLRAACLDAVAELMAAAPEVIAVAGAAEQTSTWDAASSLDLARFAPGPGARCGRGRRSGQRDCRRRSASARWLLGQAGYTGERILQSVAADEPAAPVREHRHEPGRRTRTGVAARHGRRQRQERAEGARIPRRAGARLSTPRSSGRSGPAGSTPCSRSTRTWRAT